MSLEIKLPDLGDNIDSGTVVSIFVAEGDAIEQDQARPHRDTLFWMCNPWNQEGAVVKNTRVDRATDRAASHHLSQFAIPRPPAPILVDVQYDVCITANLDHLVCILQARREGFLAVDVQPVRCRQSDQLQMRFWRCSNIHEIQIGLTVQQVGES